MGSSGERRWQLRFNNFEKALAQLDQACAKEQYSDLERAGLIKTFEFAFELSWKVLKDLLFHEGYNAKTPRSVIRKSFEADYIDEEDCEILLNALDRRNLLSHIYRRQMALEAETLIKEQYHPVLARLYRNLDARNML